MLASIHSRAELLSKSKHMPKNRDKPMLDAATTDLGSLKANWAAASSSFAAGNVSDAVATAQAIKEKGLEIMRKLAMTAA